MTTSRCVLAADARAVAGMVRDTELWRAAGMAPAAPWRLLAVGDAVTAQVGADVLALTVREVRPDLVALDGPGGALVTRIEPVGQGVVVTETLDHPAAADVLAARAEVLRGRVAALTGTRVVVATALVRDGRLLAAQRAEPPSHAGLWELPGGSVEPGETEAAAVARECREELGTEVEAMGRIGTDLPIPPGVLRVHRAALLPGSPEPKALEHLALRWLAPAELAEPVWADADRAVLPDLVALLSSSW